MSGRRFPSENARMTVLRAICAWLPEFLLTCCRRLIHFRLAAIPSGCLDERVIPTTEDLVARAAKSALRRETASPFSDISQPKELNIAFSRHFRCCYTNSASCLSGHKVWC